jgi:aromatic ring-opening dioxygenase catalytic subunit (LigB family)
MAELVGAITMSHGSSMISQPEKVTACVREQVFAAMKQARDALVTMEPDALIFVGTDHFNTFFIDDMPKFCIGTGTTFPGWADNIPFYEVHGSHQAAEQLAEAVGPTVNTMGGMRLDHSFFGPLHYLTPQMDLPVLPIFQNCIAEPMPSLSESHDFGRSLRTAIDRISQWNRLVLVGSGGLSHWIGGPEHSRVSSDFDQAFLSAFTSGNLNDYQKMSSSDLELSAGNGGHEIRNWLTVRAAAPEFGVEVLIYRPIREWLVGFSAAILRP